MLISILISLLILCLVVAVIFWILSLLPVPQPFMNIAKAIVAIICLIWLLSMLGGAVHPLYIYR